MRDARAATARARPVVHRRPLATWIALCVACPACAAPTRRTPTPARVALSAPTEAPAELVTRARAELAAAGFVVVEAGAPEPTAEVRLGAPPGRYDVRVRIDGAGARAAEERRLAIELGAPGAAGRGEAAAEIALRAAELLRARLEARAAEAAPARVPTKAQVELGLGVARGIVPSAFLTGLDGALRARRGRAGLALRLFAPLGSSTATAASGRARVRTGFALVEAELTAWDRGAAALRISLGAGGGVTTVDGEANAPAREATARLPSAALTAGARLELALPGPFVGAFELRGLTLQPRPGVRIGAAAAPAAWMLPLAAITIGARL